eukprot:365282-Chlamydomonas_euryale.AAC.2
MGCITFAPSSLRQRQLWLNLYAWYMQMPQVQAAPHIMRCVLLHDARSALLQLRHVGTSRPVPCACAVSHVPYATRHAPCATHHMPLTICHAPYAMRHAPCAMCHAPCAMRPVPCAMRHAPRAMRHAPSLMC